MENKLPWLILDPKSWGKGVWFYGLCRALRARNEESINLFIKSDVPIIVNLLCTVCSGEARHLIAKRHPSQYTEIYDSRGEKIGMYLWMFDLHNDVNKRLGKEIFSREEVDFYYLPLLSLTTTQIKEDWVSAQRADTMKNIWDVSFTEAGHKAPSHDPASWGPGVWFYVFCRALRSRTDKTIASFIGYDVPILIGLLCSVCSEEAYKLISARHPSTYQAKKDHRGERIGMYLWISDLHNDVNRHLKKPHYPQSIIDKMYGPLLDLTEQQITEDEHLASRSDTITKIRHIVYADPEGAPLSVPIGNSGTTTPSVVPIVPVGTTGTSGTARSRRLNPAIAARLKQ